MKTDCSFDSEAESFDSDSEIEIKIIEKPENQVENINIIKPICNILSTIIEDNKKLPYYNWVIK